MHLQVATSGEAVGGSRYRTLGRLGSGGMAEVDLALQTGVAGSSRLCVLKRVRRDLAGRQEFVSMFFEEARISASLNHPNIVQIYEVGGDEHDCFLAMEFLRGRSYAHVQSVSAQKTLDYRVDLEVMLATLTGLEHAHGRRDLTGEPMHLVHRDISPPNLLVTYEGEITFDSSGELLILAEADVNVPHGIPFIGGKRLGSLDFLLKFDPKAAPQENFVAAWTKVMNADRFDLA